ncbi:MAG: phage holin family protein [Clostridiales bacterium]|nr:phage holin family protein [Clostridiales bacterium]
MKETAIKGTLSAAFAALTVYLNQMLIPLIVLVIALIVDYITGMTKAWINSQLSSQIGFKGIVKKIGYLIVVCCGMGVDWLIHTAVVSTGVEMNAMYLFGMIACIWLIINEMISVIENLSIIGVPVPEFLKKVMEKLKQSAEDKMNRGD